MPRKAVDAVRGSNPEDFVEAVQAQIEGPIDRICRWDPALNRAELRWILMELACNAILAPLGSELMRRTGLSRKALLDAFGCSVPWPGGAARRMPFDASDPAVRRIEAALGCAMRRFLLMPLREKFRRLSSCDRPCRVSVECRTGPGGFSVSVRSDVPASDEDRRLILRRLRDPDAAAVELRKERAATVDRQGVFHVRSFTGGGGAGLIICARKARAMGLRLAGAGLSRPGPVSMTLSGGSAESRRIRIVRYGARRRQWARRLLRERWAGPEIVTRGRLWRADLLRGFVALRSRAPVGLATFRIEGGECELVTLDSLAPRAGVGTALVKAVADRAAKLGCARLWLVATNDNEPARRFYLKMGFQVAARHPGAVDAARMLKPGIPELGLGGVRIRDEIEFEVRLPLPADG